MSENNKVLHADGSGNGAAPVAGRMTGLAALPPKSLVNEAALAEAFAVTKRTIRRMVVRGELPPPVRLAGKSTWMAERVLAHFEARAEHAARAAEREARRLEGLGVPRVRVESAMQESETKPA